MTGLARVWTKQMLEPKGPRVLLICVARPGPATSQDPSGKKLPLKAQKGAQVSAPPQDSQGSPQALNSAGGPSFWCPPWDQGGLRCWDGHRVPGGGLGVADLCEMDI